jgi:ribose transport system ATP-binding protein
MSQQTKPGTVSRLEIRGLCKSFGTIAALQDLDLQVAPGEIHGVVGRNGSGKSTLIKILSGYHHADFYQVLKVAGEPYHPGGGVTAARRAGIGFVHQDLGLSPEASVLENMRVGRWARSAAGLIPWRAELAQVARELAQVGLDVDPRTRMRELSIGAQSLVAIARALSDVNQLKGRGVLVLDEPTVALTAVEVDALFTAARAIAESGASILFVSHRLAEIKAVTDRVTVLRDGRHVAEFDTATCTEEDLVDAILGRRLTEFYPARAASGSTSRCSVSGLKGSGVGPVDIDVAVGQIVGLTGLVGAGHEALPYLITGAAAAEVGTLTIGSRQIDCATLTPERAIAAGLVLIPADRKQHGLVPAFSIGENVTLPVLSEATRCRFLSLRAARRIAARAIRRYGIQPPLPGLPAANLSGGNQQKVVLAKWLQREPQVIVMHEPTQGIDVGAKLEIFSEIEQAAQNGAGIILCSSEYEDLAHLCHRVLIFGDGRIAAELTGDMNEDRLVEECYRASTTRTRRRQN